MNENSDSSRSPLRFFRFGTRTLLLLVTVLCVGLAWHVYKTNDRNRLICEKLVDTELLNIHFQSWETDPNAAQLIKAFASDLSTTAPTYESHVLYSNGTRQDGSAADDFERALVNHWSKASETDNEHAVRGHIFSSTFTFYKPIRAGKSCVMCHQGINGVNSAPKLLKPGDLMSVIEIELEK